MPRQAFDLCRYAIGVANDTELARAHLPQGFRYAGVISMAGAFWLKAKTPLAFKSKPAPILFFHGAKDQLVTYDEHQGAFSGYGPAYYCRTFHGPEYPKWFVDYPEGDHIVAATPTIPPAKLIVTVSWSGDGAFESLVRLMMRGVTSG